MERVPLLPRLPDVSICGLVRTRVVWGFIGLTPQRITMTLPGWSLGLRPSIVQAKLDSREIWALTQRGD